MVKEFILPLLVLSMMGNGKMENTMVLDHLFGPMEVYIKVNGKTVEKMARVNSQEGMGLYMKENGKMVNTMGKGS